MPSALEGLKSIKTNQYKKRDEVIRDEL